MARLAGLKRVGLDTAVFIYALENHPVFGKPSLALFEAVEAGRMSATACDLVLAELMVQPLRLNRNDVAERYLNTLPSFPNLSFRSVSRQVVVEAAHLRARSGLGLVDALHIASAKDAGAEAFITNDVRLDKPDLGLNVVLIKDLV